MDSVDILFHFHGTTSSSLIGTRVKGLGDINNDGFDDIAVNSQAPIGTYIFYGGSQPDSTPNHFLRGSIDRGRSVDFTNDSIPDLVTLLSSENKIFFYKVYADSLESLPSDSIAPDSGTFGFGSSVTPGLVSNDNIGDLLISDKNNPGGGKLYYYENPFTTDKTSDWTFEISDNSHSLFSVAMVDFNGDSYEDAVVALKAHLDSVSYVYLFYGPQFSDSPNVVLTAPPGFESLDQERFGDAVFNIGDVNGDNWEDLAIIFHSRVLIYLCGPGADSLYDFYLLGGAKSMSSAGDVNGDGTNDIIAGDGRTLHGAVDIYLGGRNFDIYSDKSIVRSDLPPLFLNRIGFDVSSAGDFNNDGYDDILFSCQNFFGGDPGDVFVVSGSPNITTDIKDEAEVVLPDQYELFQNYPNPFNSSTTISFHIPRRGPVTVNLFNVNGQLVATLIDKDLSAGHHSVSWKGYDNDGNSATSGVYICRLKAGHIELSRKLILIK